MKTLTLFASVLVIFALTVNAQDPMIEWENTIGGNSYDFLHSAQPTADGGYILGGETASGISGDKTEANHNWDYWVVKLDAAGNIVWQNTIGGDSYDFLYSIQQTTDGGYILGGESGSGISGDKTEALQGNDFNDYWIVKLDGDGNIVWQNTIGGYGPDALSSIQQTADGGYILAGYSGSPISGDKTETYQGGWDYWVIKLDNAGNILWQNTIGGNDDDYPSSIRQTSDGGYVLAGYSYSGLSGDKTEASQSPGLFDNWILKLDSAGNIVWQNTIGGNNQDSPSSIQQTADGGYIVAASSESDISGDKTEANQGPVYTHDGWLIKLDAAGNIVWQNTIGGIGSDYFSSIQQTANGDYIVGGTSYSDISGDKTENSQESDYWVIKLDEAGNIVWQNTIRARWDDRLVSAHQTADGGYMLAGYSNSGISEDKSEADIGRGDFWVVKLKPVSEPSPACAAGERKVHSLTLVDADSDTDISTLHNGDVIDLSVTEPINVRANVCDDGVVESVKFQLNGVNYRKENIPFYTIAGDNGGHYDVWNITPGTYTISAIPYGSDNASGTIGTPLSVTISVIQSGANKTSAQVESIVSSALQVFPNPSEGVFKISFTVEETEDVKVEVYDLLGKMVYRDEMLSFSGAYSKQLDLSMYGQGIYMLKVQEGGMTRTKKIVVNR